MLRLLLTFCLILLPGAADAADVTGLVPAVAAPGTPVTVMGGPFDEGTRIALGDREIIPGTVAPHRLTFTVPALAEGEYAFSLKGTGAGTAPAFIFRVIEAVPRIESLAPTSLDACSLQEGGSLVLSGEFPVHPRVLLDGAVVPVDKAGKGEIVLSLPPLKGGIHRVEVTGNERNISLPHALSVNSVPRIASVSQGEDHVTSYEVIISGENFLFNSTLVVDGTALNQVADVDSVPAYSALERLGGEDYVRYVDCRTLVYVRHPVTREPKTVTLQVVNPGNEQSPVYVVAIP
jgi:hypothetical protein